jgi:hypothetical protein
LLSIGESLETANADKLQSEGRPSINTAEQEPTKVEAEAAQTPETTPQTSALEPSAPNAGGKGKGGKKKKGGK